MSSAVTPERTLRHITTTVKSSTEIQVQVIDNMRLIITLKTQYHNLIGQDTVHHHDVTWPFPRDRHSTPNLLV